MKKMNHLKLLILCCYLLLSASYSYGMLQPIGNTTNTSMTSKSSPTPLLLSLCLLIQQGKTYHDQKDYLTAIATYNDALQKYGQHYREKSILLSMIYHRLGISYLAIKTYPQSHDYLQQALTIRKNFLSIANSSHNKVNAKAISEITGESHHHLGCLYLAMNQPRKALISFEAALATEWQHHEKSKETRCYFTKAYQAQKEFDKAILPPELSAIAASSCASRRNLVRHQESNTKGVRAERSEVPNEGARAEAKPKYLRNQAPKVLVLKHSRSILKPFQCPICQKQFSQKQHMKVHMRMHTGEKPFACPVCQKKFSRKDNMKIHMRSHTGEKPFQCPVCNKKISRKNNVKTHMRSHTGEKPFACPICRKKFPQKCHIKTHLRVHTGEKPFACPVCQKKFAKKENIKAHLRVHTGEKPFTCPLCRKKFSTKENSQVAEWSLPH